jgi:hypothetical protein
MDAERIDEWLAQFSLPVLEREQREGATSWDVILDGRKRRALRVTLILVPAVALVAWAHLAPPISDNFRKTYRQLLRWNDELPFAKFAVSHDERPILTVEMPLTGGLDADAVGRLLARVLAIADLIHDESLELMGELRRRHAKLAAESEADPAGVALLERFAADLEEVSPPVGESPG